MKIEVTAYKAPFRHGYFGDYYDNPKCVDCGGETIELEGEGKQPDLVACFDEKKCGAVYLRNE